MWNKLKRKIRSDIVYHENGNIGNYLEHLHKEEKCEEILKYMDEIERNKW